MEQPRIPCDLRPRRHFTPFTPIFNASGQPRSRSRSTRRRWAAARDPDRGPSAGERAARARDPARDGRAVDARGQSSAQCAASTSRIGRVVRELSASRVRAHSQRHFHQLRLIGGRKGALAGEALEQLEERSTTGSVRARRAAASATLEHQGDDLLVGQGLRACELVALIVRAAGRAPRSRSRPRLDPDRLVGRPARAITHHRREPRLALEQAQERSPGR